jgi:uncharacterized membrane protein
MNPSRRRRPIGFAVLLLSLLGMWAALSHYLVHPDAAVVLQTNPLPGKEWFLQQMPRYGARPSLTALHVVPAFLFMLLVPIQLSHAIRRRRPALHRWSGRALVAVSGFIALSGIVIGIIMPFGGSIETAATTLIGVLFLAALVPGVVRARQKRYTEHRRWMLRMVAIGFVPVTMRLLMMGAVAGLQLQAPAVFGPTMLLGLAINLAVVEFALQRGRRVPRLDRKDSAAATGGA